MKLPLLDQFLANDFLVRYELADYDPFEAAINLGHALAPETNQKNIRKVNKYGFRMEMI